jgi:hypothetical protein
MSLDARTGNVSYNTNDLLGFARLGAFGQKSNVLLSALMKLSYYEYHYPLLEKELNELREIVKISGAVDEIVVQDLTTKPKVTTKK